MVWGAPKGVDDWVERLNAQDATLTSIHVFRARRFQTPEVLQLCTALRENKTLTELYASGHSMDTEAVQAVSDMLAVNTTLVSLCVGDTEFGDEGVAVLAKGISQNQSLTKLDLEAKSFSVSGARALGEALGACTTLQHLQLGRNLLDDECILALVEGLQISSALLTLDLHENSLTHVGARHLVSFLNSERCQLTSLRLAGNATLGSEGIATLAEGLQQNRSLGGEGIAALCTAVASAKQLKSLNLSECKIGPEGGTAFAKTLFESSQGLALRKLDLRANSLDATAVSAFAESLCNSATDDGSLDLDLGENKVDEGGMEWLAKGNKLKRLSLFNTEMGDQGVSCLARQLQMGQMSAIEYLDLCGVGMEMVSASELSRAMMHGNAPALGVLEIAANPATQKDEFEDLIKELREARPGLDVVWRTTDPGEKQRS